ncbi:hypothetical protein LDFHOB_05315 [Candidatus Electronema aureum]
MDSHGAPCAHPAMLADFCQLRNSYPKPFKANPLLAT